MPAGGASVRTWGVLNILDSLAGIVWSIILIRKLVQLTREDITSRRMIHVSGFEALRGRGGGSQNGSSFYLFMEMRWLCATDDLGVRLHPQAFSSNVLKSILMSKKRCEHELDLDVKPINYTGPIK